jgi:glycine C-acetyltransferase
MRKDIPQIGMTYQILNKDGIYDLRAIAKEFYEQKTHLDKLGQWTHDRYLKQSSHARGKVRTESSPYFKDCSVWSINHYLGLNRHPYVIKKAQEATAIYGTGCGTSAMSGGHSQLHKNLQKRFAQILSKEECLLFPTGFTANTGTIAALCKGSETLIIIDRDSHASIIDGCRASQSKYIPFKHNSVQDLEQKLKRYSTMYVNLLVVIESAYSMEGDIAPLEKIVALKDKYNFLLYVDEAHTFGFYGKNGSGLCNQLGVADDVDFIMTTLSKSTASIGGIVATSKEFATFLRWSTSYLFQAAIPAADVAVANACLDLISTQPEIIESLWAKTHYLRQRLLDLGFDIGKSESPVIPVYVRDSDILKKMEKDLYKQGIFTIAIQYPIVKVSEVRFRFIVNNSHTLRDIDHLIAVLYDLGIKYDLIQSGKSCMNLQ